jgi:hypothetical protein
MRFECVLRAAVGGRSSLTHLACVAAAARAGLTQFGSIHADGTLLLSGPAEPTLTNF